MDRTESAMGTAVRIAAYGADPERVARAVDAAFARVHELDAHLTDYDPTSELSRLSHRSDEAAPTPPIALSQDLFTVLRRAVALAARTQGAFDVTVGPLVHQWRHAARQVEVPDPERLAAARALVGPALLTLDATDHTARLHARGMRLDLGGIAKGYVLDQALATLERHGVPSALLDAGGDIVTGKPPPGRSAWRVAVGSPSTGRATELVLALARGAVATSGDAYRGITLDGVRYSHLVDPRTGQALSPPVGATVVAPDGMSADALASAACVLGAEAGRALLMETPGVEGRIVVGGPEGAVVSTPGFDALLWKR